MILGEVLVLADAEASAAIMVHAAGRHGASDLPELARITGSPIKIIGAAAGAAAGARSMALG